MAVGKSHSSYQPLDDAVTIAEEFDIVAAKAGLIGVYELSNIALLRDVYVESYFASTENYRILRDEVEQPEKAALAYRDFVRAAMCSGVQGFSP